MDMNSNPKLHGAESCEVISSSAGQAIILILWNQKVHYSFYISLYPEPGESSQHHHTLFI
jgi:hypothetical protein